MGKTKKQKKEKKLTQAEKKVLYPKEYIKVCNELKRHPQQAELTSACGITRENLRNTFGSITELKKFVKDNHSNEIVSVLDQELFNTKTFKQLEINLKAYNRFVITTAVEGDKVHTKALSAIKNYCRENNAALLVMTSDNILENIAPELRDEHIVFDELELNKSLHLCTIKIGAKQINPTTGLQRLGQRDGSFIFASPKQNYKSIAVAGRGIPHVLMTTGCITLPDYHGDLYIQRRTDYIATSDHVMGALVVELEADDIHFHVRQLQFEEGGSFVDLGKYYHPSSATGVLNPKALVLGDWHSIETDPTVRALLPVMVADLCPEELILHDAFDGKSINPHEKNSLLSQVKNFITNKWSLKEEVKILADDLNWMAKMVKKVVMVKSNHDIFLMRYLNDRSWINDVSNFSILIDILHALIHRGHKDPLQYALTSNGMNSENVLFLQEDESYKIANIELGVHGHRGSNGAKGTLPSMEVAYGLCVTAHVHTPEILRGAWQVGTSSILDPDYAKGASSWMHTHCLVFPNGSRQLITIINGKYRL